MTNYIYANDYHPDAGKLEPGQFSARGNYGELICDLATGKVIKYLADTDADEEQNYEDVEALDVAEFERENGHKVEDQGFYDVLNFEAILKAGAPA
jgi:hypothetical protein